MCSVECADADDEETTGDGEEVVGDMVTKYWQHVVFATVIFRMSSPSLSKHQNILQMSSVSHAAILKIKKHNLQELQLGSPPQYHPENHQCVAQELLSVHEDLPVPADQYLLDLN